MTPDQYKAARERIGTQEQVADMLELSRITIARRETGALPIPKEAELAIKYLNRKKPK